MYEAYPKLTADVAEFGTGRVGEWTGQSILAQASRLGQYRGSGKLLHLTGEAPNWVFCAVAAEMAPMEVYQEWPSGEGTYQLICTPLPVDAAGSAYGVTFTVTESRSHALLTAATDWAAFHIRNLDRIVLPPVLPPRHIWIAGELPVPVAISAVLTHIRHHSSIWYTAGKQFICVASNCTGYAVGDEGVPELA